MKTRNILGAVSVALAMITCGQNSPRETPSVPGSSDKQGFLTAEQFVCEAAWLSSKEIQFSELALRKAIIPEIRHFAQTLVADHTKINSALKRIASRKGIPFPSEVNAEPARQDSDNPQPQKPRDPAKPQDNQRGAAGSNEPPDSSPKSKETPAREHARRSLRQLEGANGTEFDRLYIEAMVADHGQAVRKFEMALQRLDDTDLKQFASSTLPVLRDHQSAAHELAQSAGVLETRSQISAVPSQP